MLAQGIVLAVPAAASGPPPSDGGQGPCDPRLDQPGYVSGVDAVGNPVVQADLPAAKTPVPSEVLVPLGKNSHRPGRGPVAVWDGKTLDTLLNPAPACPARSH
jgi:hypothetical protein